MTGDGHLGLFVRRNDLLGVAVLLGHEAQQLGVREIAFSDENSAQGRGLAVPVRDAPGAFDEGFAELIRCDQPPLQQHLA
jgi:hypothetical protein